MRTFAIQSDPSAVRRFPGVALLFTLLALVVFAVPSLTGSFEFERSLVADGQWWRLTTCHWAHWSADHLFWDLIVFAALGAVCERINRSRLVVCLVVSAVLIPCAVWLLAPGLTFYRGLSGLDSALFTLLLSMLAWPAILEKRWGGRGGDGGANGVVWGEGCV